MPTRRCWAIGVAALAAVAAGATPSPAARETPGVNAYVVSNLVSDGFDPHTTLDKNLVNAWGLAASGTGPWWTANEAAETSTLYTGTGGRLPLVVTVRGGPTGVVFNGTSGFTVTSGAASAPARFIFACEDGMIRGWASTVPAAGSTVSYAMVDSRHRAAVYRGLAEATDADGSAYLYAADFHNGRVDVFDSRWQRLPWKGAFVDRRMPAWYGPFGIQAIGNRVFVTYASPAPVNGNDSPTGGYVDVFSLKGKLLARVARRGPLNQPVDVAPAPPTFGKFGGDLLVGNFGDGRIGVYRELRPGGGATWAPSGLLTSGSSRSTAFGASSSATAARPDRRTRSTSPPDPIPGEERPWTGSEASSARSGPPGSAAAERGELLLGDRVGP